jgi:hypothetical protein
MVVAVILLLAGLLLLLRALLGQLLSWQAFLLTDGGGRRRGLLRSIEGGGGGGNSLQPLCSLLDFLQAEVVKHLLERQEVCHMREDGMKVFEFLVQPTQGLQHENMIRDVDTEIGKGVGEALHLLTVDIDTEVTLNEALEGGIDVEGVSLVVAEEVVLR